MVLHYTCEWCGKKGVDTKKKTRRFCSIECKRAYEASRREDRACQYCGKLFTVSLDSKYQSQRHVCSRSCWTRLHHPPRADSKSIFTCEWCGNDFQEWTYRKPRFCSNQCRSEFAARQPKLASRKPEIHITRECAICGNAYKTTTHQLKYRNSKYCCTNCRHKGLSVNRMGALNPMYTGGTKFPDRGHNWFTQRRLALSRDGHKCQICGRKPKRGEKRVLDVHHITPYRLFNGDWLSANELGNLITLCRNCHAKAEDGEIPCPKRLL